MNGKRERKYKCNILLYIKKENNKYFKDKKKRNIKNYHFTKH